MVRLAVRHHLIGVFVLVEVQELVSVLGLLLTLLVFIIKLVNIQVICTFRLTVFLVLVLLIDDHEVQALIYALAVEGNVAIAIIITSLFEQKLTVFAVVTATVLFIPEVCNLYAITFQLLQTAKLGRLAGLEASWEFVSGMKQNHTLTSSSGDFIYSFVLDRTALFFRVVKGISRRAAEGALHHAVAEKGRVAKHIARTDGQAEEHASKQTLDEFFSANCSALVGVIISSSLDFRVEPLIRLADNLTTVGIVAS